MLSPINSIPNAALTAATTPIRLNPAAGAVAAPETGAATGTQSFGNLFTRLVDDVSSAQQGADVATRQVMLGQTDQLHTAMISLQESSVALSLMVQVRNRLVESYQELMRMSV